MTDKAKLHEQQTRAAEAQRVFNEPLLKEFIAAARQEFIDLFLDSDVNDDKARYHARVALGVITNIQNQFEKCKHDGEVATAQLLDLKETENKD